MSILYFLLFMFFKFGETLQLQHSCEYLFKSISYQEGLQRIHTWESNPMFAVHCTRPPFKVGKYNVLAINATSSHMPMYVYSQNIDKSNVFGLDRYNRPNFLITFEVSQSSLLGHSLKMNIYGDPIKMPFWCSFLPNRFHAMCALEDAEYFKDKPFSCHNEYLAKYKRMALQNFI